MTRLQVVLAAILVAATLGPTVLLGLPALWRAVQTGARRRFERDLRADLAAAQACWQRMWCPLCDVRSLTTDRVCPTCDVTLVPLSELDKFQLPLPASFTGRDRRRDETVMVDQVASDRRAHLRRMQ